MKLSILIPVYNAEEHLGRCLDSLLDQELDYHDYEILLRDDGSTDGSVDLINTYTQQAPHIKLTRDTNKGAYVQRNLLMAQATGDYLYFMDADDYLVRKSLGKILKLAYKHDLDLCCFNIKLTFNKDNEIPFIDQQNLNNSPLEVISGKTYLEQNQEMRYEIWWYFIKRSFLKDSGIVFNEGRYHHDVLFTLKLLLKAKRLIFIPTTVYCYFQSTGSIMRTSTREHADRLLKAGRELTSGVNKLIHKVSKDGSNKKLLDNLKYSRDKFAFYLCIRKIKAGYSLNEIKKLYSYLKSIDSYPIAHYTGKDMPLKKYLSLRLLINHTCILKAYLKFKRTR
ncbi:MAG: glycosyltransferase [Leeuwenhoekiella sp.]